MKRNETWSSDAPDDAPKSEDEARYSLGHELGRGGMGRVVLARDQVLSRDVACKLLDSPGAEKFVREARLTARLDHPGIVPIYDAGIMPDGTPFYTMRLLEGKTLADHLKIRGEPSRMVDVLIGACRAVAHAHQRGIVHRDLKPENLMVGSLGEVQVVDWGIAIDLSDAAPQNRAGSPAYMSPEQARGERLTPATDVWSLGVVLWEMLAGKPWIHGVPTEIVAALAASQPPNMPPVAPAELDAVVRRATRLEPGERYPDAAALLADLVAWR